MRLSEKEREILYATELNLDRSMASLTKELRIRSHTLRYHVTRLEERGLILRLPLVNPFVLGFSDFTFFLCLSTNSGSKVRARFVERLRTAPQVSWVGELGGRYHIGTSILASTIHEVTLFFADLAKEFGEILYERSFALRTASTIFGKRYLSARKHRYTPLTYKMESTKVTMDDTDVKILTGLFDIPHRSQRELAQKLGLNPMLVHRRIALLQSRGVLLGFFNGTSEPLMDVEPYKIIVRTRSGAPSVAEGIKDFCFNNRNVTHLIEALGAWDFEIGVDVQDSKALVSITGELYDKFGSLISDLEVIPELSCLKFQNCPLPRKPVRNASHF